MLESSLKYAPYIPLIMCSIIGLALIVERSYTFLSRKVIKGGSLKCAPETVEDTLRALLQEKSFYRAALLSLSENSNIEKPLRDEVVSLTLQQSGSVLRKNLSGLMTISALAPLFGLLGTIIGLMRAFKNIGQNQGPVEPHLIADGLWQALITTAIGLIIAAICIIAHAIFSSLMRRRLAYAKVQLNSISLAQSGIVSTL